MDRTKLLSGTQKALQRATNHAWSLQKPDGHWCAEIRANVTVTAEHIFLYASLGSEPKGGFEPYKRFILSEQNRDGSWSLAPFYPGDVSTSAEAYLALKLCGLKESDSSMVQASDFIRKAGGIANVRMFTRIFFATFGLFPWSAVPELPPELILLPTWFPGNVYDFASWARSTIIPLLLISHHRPVYPIPIAGAEQQKWLDELWLDPSSKNVPYSASVSETQLQDITCMLLSLADKVVAHVSPWLRWLPSRRVARAACVQWILDHQEKEGDWAGIVMPMLCSIQALRLEGFAVVSPQVHAGLDAIDRFIISDQMGNRVQACVSPHWDTVLMVSALCDGISDSTTSGTLRKTIEWITSRQQLGPEGNWRVFSPSLAPGGFSFEYHNAWYPDVDDTVATILAFVKYDASLVHSPVVLRAVTWILGMQNPDGGFAAFDKYNNKLWLNKIAFSDMDALCDPSTSDISGRVLEAFGLIFDMTPDSHKSELPVAAMYLACEQSLAFLAGQQESSGAWFGRWGCNYVYGTSGVLTGLEYFASTRDDAQSMVSSAVSWLKSVQNEDGGWGEDLMSYKKAHIFQSCPSTPSQTAWALMGLLPYVSGKDEVVARGIAYLIRTQVGEDPSKNTASWREDQYTGTGFPKHFYFGYDLYRHYFPMMALGRFLRLHEDGLSEASGIVGLDR